MLRLNVMDWVSVKGMYRVRFEVKYRVVVIGRVRLKLWVV